jgi:DNA-binding LacI/PurR family transcriptional regulator
VETDRIQGDTVAGVTSADVARESGVSRTTVSYVLNGTAGARISAETRDRVHETARRLGYAPSAAARTLRRGRNDLVLCVLPDLPVGPAIGDLLDCLATALAGRGLSVPMHHNRGPRPLAELWRQVTPRAVVGLTAFADEDVLAMRQAGIQVLGGALDEDNHQGVFAVPQSQIGRLQVTHLADRGHRAIGYAAPTDARLAAFADQRLVGVRRECAERGLLEPHIERVDLDVQSAAAAVQSWRAHGPVTAVAAYNDDLALAVLAGARSAGLRVPDDIAVVGVDDVPAARLASPALSTVCQVVDAQAGYVAAAVLAALDGTEPPAHPTDVLNLVARDST